MDQEKWHILFFLVKAVYSFYFSHLNPKDVIFFFFRLEQQELQMQKRAQKRTFENRGGDRRDDYWSEPKRAATNDNRFDDNR